MKKKLFTLLFAIVASVGAMFARDYVLVQIDDLYYNLDEENGTAEVTYKSYSSIYLYNRGWNISTAVIPASISYNTVIYSVTSIGECAFFGCTSLTSVTIPNSVTSIGDGAFFGCTSLTSVTIPNSVTSIGSSAFLSVPNIMYDGIATGARWGAKCLNGYAEGWLVYSDNSKTNIVACSTAATGTIEIPNSVTSIGDGVFQNCSGLTSIILPDGLTSIGEEAFNACFSLTSIILPDGLTSIGTGAFSACSSLSSINIPSSVMSIGYYPFDGCNSLPVIDNIRYADTYLIRAVNKNLTTYTIQSGTRFIDSQAFDHCTNMTSITIPNGVIYFGSFHRCTSLTSVIIPESVTRIEGGTFDECSNLQEITVLATTPPTFSYYNFGCNPIVYVPLFYTQLYKEANVWRTMNIQAYVENDIRSDATSVKIEMHDDNIASYALEGGETFAGNTLEYIGLEPNSEYANVPVVLTSNTGIVDTVKLSFTTSALTITTQNSKPVSSTTAILLAETNMADIETNCGFEWKRNDAPEDMDGNKVFCPVANGQMAGRLKGLRDDTYYKYRAFYQSAGGNMYYGDWKYIFTGDIAVEFDPILYTYAATAVTEDEATLKGYALAGSDDFTEQGFEYWAESRVANNAPRRMRTALGEHHTVTASGISMRATLTDLDAGTVYKYRTYAKVGGQVLYGSEMSFTTQGEYAGTEDVEKVELQENRSHKILRNGQILILRGDKTYTLTGAVVK